MIVVSDTTAITSLLKIRKIELLRDLFGEAVIPKAVRDELLKYHKALPEFLKIEAVQNQAAVNSLRGEIDQGEAEAIILAQEIKADVLLIDEKQGRSVAERRGIRCLGLAGAIILAKQSNLIPSAREVLDALEREANFYLDADLKQSLLRRANETV